MTNRTFMRINEPMIRSLAKEGKVLGDEATRQRDGLRQPLPGEALGTVHDRGGNYDKCIAWAIKVGPGKGRASGRHRSAPGR